MKQDVGFFDVGGACPDIVIEDGDLKADNGLETAALISLFTNVRLTREQLQDQEEQDLQGWWADTISTPVGDKIGSALWNVIERAKTDQEALNRATDAARGAFEWMIEDGLAKDVEVSAERSELGRILISLAIFKPDGDDIPFRVIWDAQSLKISEGSNGI